MCVVNKEFEHLKSLFLIPFMLTCSMMRFLSLLLLGLCACLLSVAMWCLFWSVYEVVSISYVGVVVVVTVMCVLLFVLCVCVCWGMEKLW